MAHDNPPPMEPLKSLGWVCVGDAEMERDLRTLLPVLETLMQVRLSSGTQPSAVAIGRIAVPTSDTNPPPTSVPTLILPPTTIGRGIATIKKIRFADDPRVPWPFRARSLIVNANLDAEVHHTLGASGGIVLATDEHGAPLWTVDVGKPSSVHRTSLRPPHAPTGSDAGLAVGNERFIQALPLFQFLRELTRERSMANPPLRAGYIIDDPNLHWPTYGYADYRRIAESARTDRYHVAFATIPLDGWWVHSPTAAIFRASAGQLSLLIHGNNHAKHELAQDFSQHDCAALLRQAIGRIEQLESKANLQVSRVMVPPHGACSSRMLSELPRQGFESACISAGSLRAHNPGQPWTRSLGIAPSETVEGCAVLPRWAFAGTTDAVLLTAAYLGQPLILRGHHQDLKDGLRVLQGFAETINALGDVHWGNLTDLSRLNFRYRRDGAVMSVEPLGVHARVAVPEGINQIRIQSGHADWKVIGPQAEVQRGDAGGTFDVKPGYTYSLIRTTPHATADAPRRTLPTSTKLIVRRILTETRDRLRVE